MNESPQNPNFHEQQDTEPGTDECPRSEPPASDGSGQWAATAGDPPRWQGHQGPVSPPPGYAAPTYAPVGTFSPHQAYPGANAPGSRQGYSFGTPPAPPNGTPPPTPPAGGGFWGAPAWPPPGPHSQWPASGPVARTTNDKKRSRGRTAIATGLVAIIAVAGLLGAVIGHAVWQKTTANSSLSSGTTFPSSNSQGGFLDPRNSNGSSSNGSSSNGSSSNGSSSSGTSSASAAAVAQKVDPGLVDIDTMLGYEEIEGAGTGMVLTSNGLVLTNNHVVEGATSIKVTDIGNGKTYNAKVLGYDRVKDVALLKLQNASGLATVTIAKSGVSTGQQVVAIGNAGGSGGTPSYAAGTVTAINQSITASDEATNTSEQLTGLIETNADIVAGDSGGPLVNSAGQVIAMDTAAAQSFQFQSSGNQGYSIPITTASTIVKDIHNGSASTTVHVGATAFLGVEVSTESSGYSQTTSGAEIAEVVSGGPAADAGLAEGDTITSFDGSSISSPEDLTNVILTKKPGDSVSVVYTDPSGAQHTVSVHLASGPPQ